MDKKQARKFIKDREWVFAKTYADTFPHEYTVRKDDEDNKVFNSFIMFMRDNSKIKRFFNKEYLYCELDGIEYWEMGRAIPIIKVINRAPINDNAYYRKEITSQENWQKLYNALKEREERVYDLLIKKRDGVINKQELVELRKHLMYYNNIIDNSNKTMNFYL